MEQKKNDKIPQQAPSKKVDVSKTSSTTRPEIDLPLKGGRADADLANKGQVNRDQRDE